MLMSGWERSTGDNHGCWLSSYMSLIAVMYTAVGGRGTEVSQWSSGLKPGGGGGRGEVRLTVLVDVSLGKSIGAWTYFLTCWEWSRLKNLHFCWLLGSHIRVADQGQEQQLKYA